MLARRPRYVLSTLAVAAAAAAGPSVTAASAAATADFPASAVLAAGPEDPALTFLKS